ncbi:DUF3472 domain-containing protein [Luteolibacter luteus]|uniref:DUF3472 domain-containing protein n=1 Tax=Luteolibacter luteus TaxID=2728835 RepID=A0A858RH65_9BACT|nr:DUF3472 domain-containing protein [Luteolibacter luteus]QJE96217.1 DUF3472 domain-containing protein [Luteolibacter luteus]
MHRTLFPVLPLALVLVPFLSSAANGEGAKVWEVPMGGNAYVTKAVQEQSGRRGGRGMGRWDSADTVQSIYFRVDRPAELELSLKARAEGEARIRATVNGKPIEKDLKGAGEVSLGKVTVREAGYVRVDLQGLKKSGETFAEVEGLTVSAPEAVELNYVQNNEGNRFYWGRRGPSVHLGYSLPKGEPVEWFYNEITVPEGSDPIGSYFMSNGFGEGYFGMQVNGPEERRILFSVWSPFTTDNPKEIPDDHKITLLKKGEGVHGGEFGGEGSGGQSYWLYPWKAGETYRFLNRVKPDGQGSTDYTAWFFLPEKKEWKLIASFKRPKTDKHLTGAHSFLENFSDRQGYITRGALYGNQWACDVKGEWHEVTEARFTGDDIAQRKYRMDYAGGVKGKEFFMKNGGFFADNVKLGSQFQRESTAAKKPKVDFEKLEGF